MDPKDPWTETLHRFDPADVAIKPPAGAAGIGSATRSGINARRDDSRPVTSAPPSGATGRSHGHPRVVHNTRRADNL